MNLDDKNKILKEEVDVKFNFLHDTPEILRKYYQETLIVPASPQRDWMSTENQKYAYHCVPMVVASQMGWDILSPQDLIVNWNGGQQVKDVTVIDVTNKKLDQYRPVLFQYPAASSHFPVGIITFSFPFVIQTPPGWGIWVSGPSNLWLDGASPLQGLVETNWLPFSFTMNWKITEKNKPIRIPLHFPICKLVPFPLNLNEVAKASYHELDENSDFGKAFWLYRGSRSRFNEGIHKKIDGHVAGNQKFYKHGVDSSGCPYKGFHKLFYKYKKAEGVN